MRTPWQVMTVGDRLLVALLLGVALVGMLRLATAPGGARVVVSDGDRTLFTAPLGEARSVELNGPLGVTRLVIDKQGARITDSPCPRKLCVGMGPAHRTGDLVACVPNRILVRIEGPGRGEAPYDLLSR